jgi:acyl-CoA thioesterase FadM
MSGDDLAGSAADEGPAAAVRPPTDEERRASLPFRVRFDEATPTGRIRTSVLLRYAAELASVHSERLGFGRAWYQARGLAWLVRGVDLEIVGPIDYGETLIGTTEPTAARKVLARRETRFSGPDGTTVARLTVDWALTSQSGAPTRIPSIFAFVFALPEATFAPIRVRTSVPDDGLVRTLDLVVRPHELDPMGHVNNAVYLDWAEAALGALGDERAATALDAIPRRWRLEYLGAAGPASRAQASAWTDGDGWDCRVVDPATGEVLLGSRLEA